MPPPQPVQRVFVCKKCKRSACLLDFLEETHVPVQLVGCQKVCEGPVAGLAVKGRMEWFGRVDKAKPMVALLQLATGRKRKVPRPLEKRRDAKRSGRAPR